MDGRGERGAPALPPLPTPSGLTGTRSPPTGPRLTASIASISVPRPQRPARPSGRALPRPGAKARDSSPGDAGVGNPGSTPATLRRAPPPPSPGRCSTTPRGVAGGCWARTGTAERSEVVLMCGPATRGSEDAAQRRRRRLEDRGICEPGCERCNWMGRNVLALCERAVHQFSSRHRECPDGECDARSHVASDQRWIGG